MNQPSQPRLDKIVIKLAKILRIQDWDIKAHAVTGYEMNKVSDDCTNDGLSYRNVRLNTADIYLNKEKDVDWYETLIHEMIHIQTTAFLHCAVSNTQERTTYFDDLYESLIEKQAQVFCKLYPVTNFIKE